MIGTPGDRRTFLSPWSVAGWYGLITIAMTWPIAAGITRDIPGDLGDSLLNGWIIGWVADHVRQALGGHPGALVQMWNANIFHPEPLALAYSEHLFAQAVQVLPVYWLTGNLVLCYNLLFLSTYLLSGLGMYLLVREITGSPRAAFVAGLLYAFAPYRTAQAPHLQIMTSQWMPFALFGLRRYFTTRRRVALMGGVLALIAQNLSCGYYLIYFAPFAAAYVLYEMTMRGWWRSARACADVAVAGIVVAAATAPFLRPYLELRQRGQTPRTMPEVLKFSADVYSYLTAHETQVVWGGVINAFPKPEGDLFPGFVTLALALTGIAAHAGRLWHETRGARPGTIGRMRLQVALAIAAAAGVLAVVLIVAGQGLRGSIGPIDLRASDFWRTVWVACALAISLLAASPRARAMARGVPGSVVAYYGVAAVLAWWLSLGPLMLSMGRRIATAPYMWLHLYLPGFDGLRTPARYAMIVTLCFAVLGGVAAAAIERRRRGRWWLGLLAALFLVEAAAMPLPVNVNWTEPGLRPTPPHIATGSRTPTVYRFVRTLPRGTVLAEFPFGADGYEVRYMFYSTVHWRPLVNGYSGHMPASNAFNRATLGRVLDDPGRAWDALVRSGATHAIVHENAFLPGDGAAVSQWLEGRGARPVGTFQADRLFELPRSMR